MLELIFFVLVIPISLLLDGVSRKIAARFQNRIGPPLLQPFYDVLKLWRKGKYPAMNDIFFFSAPVFYFIALYALFLFIPFHIISLNFDFVLVVYLTILESSFIVLAGVSSDNPFSIISSMREMRLMVAYEITLAIALINFIIKTGATSFLAFDANMMFLALPLSSIALIIVSFVELHITPMDTAAAHSEIMAGAWTEYSGKSLAFLEIGRAMKHLFFPLFLSFLLVGTANVFVYLFSAFIIYLILMIGHVTAFRYRVDQAFKVLYFIFLLAIIEFVLVSKGVL